MIRGKNINLRALEREDLQKTHKWANDAGLSQLVGPRFPVSMAQEEAWFDAQMKNESRQLLIIETPEQEAIGYMYLDVDWVNRKAQLSMAIGERDHQDKGAGTDACQTALNHCFNQLSLNRVYLYVFEFNKRAVRLYEKCGFRKEGNIREDCLIQGKYEDRLIMGILKSEFSTEIAHA